MRVNYYPCYEWRSEPKCNFVRLAHCLPDIIIEDEAYFLTKDQWDRGIHLAPILEPTFDTVVEIHDGNDNKLCEIKTRRRIRTAIQQAIRQYEKKYGKIEDKKYPNLMCDTK